MSTIQKFKQAIDFAIFQTKPNKFGVGSNLGTNLAQYLGRFSNSLSGYNNKIDTRSKKKLEELKRKINEKIASLNIEIKGAKKNKKRDLESRLSELKEALKEIEVLINASTNYIFSINEKPQFEYLDGTNTGVVHYDGTLGSLINELKHAFQFETGKIDFIKTNISGTIVNTPGLTYDIGDEVETYKRQYAYDGILKLRITMTDEEMLQQFKSGKIKNGLGLGTLEIKKMSKITANVIVKVEDNLGSGSLYKSISGRSLDIHSSIGNIKKGNKNRMNLFNSLGLNNEKKDKAYIDFIKVFIETKPFIYVKY